MVYESANGVKIVEI